VHLVPPEKKTELGNRVLAVVSTCSILQLVFAVQHSLEKG